MFSYEEMSEKLRYDAKTGVIYRKKKDGSEKIASFYSKAQRRNRVKFKEKWMYAYRVGWLLSYGSWPENEIDHINGDSSDDRLENLRDVDRRTNQENLRKAKRTNAASVLGVSKHRNRFRAMVKVKGKSVYLGSFPTAEEAHDAYVNAKRKHHTGCTI